MVLNVVPMPLFCWLGHLAKRLFITLHRINKAEGVVGILHLTIVSKMGGVSADHLWPRYALFSPHLQWSSHYLNDNVQ